MGENYKIYMDNSKGVVKFLEYIGEKYKISMGISRGMVKFLEEG